MVSCMNNYYSNNYQTNIVKNQNHYKQLSHNTISYILGNSFIFMLLTHFKEYIFETFLFPHKWYSLLGFIFLKSLKLNINTISVNIYTYYIKLSLYYV